jgi:hypothetical protein
MKKTEFYIGLVGFIVFILICVVLFGRWRYLKDAPTSDNQDILNKKTINVFIFFGLAILVMIIFFIVMIIGASTSNSTTTSTTSNSNSIINTGSTISASNSNIIGYYKTLQSNEITSISDTGVSSGQTVVYNVYLSASNLTVPSNLTSFTSYYAYTYNGQTTVNTDTIDFLINVPVTLTSNSPPSAPSSPNTPTTTTPPIPNMPYSGQSIAFCIPLVAIPSGATNIQFGYQMNGAITSLALTSMSILNVHIFDSAGINNLPLATASISSLSIPTGPFSLAEISEYTLVAMDSTLARVDITNYSTSATTAQSSGLIYMSPFPSQTTVVNTGKWFTTTPYSSSSSSSSITTSPPYDVTYFVSDPDTPYISQSTKYNNYSIVGLNVSSEYSAYYNITPTSPSSISITFNSYPVHPVGSFPNEYEFGTQVAAYCDYNNEEVVSISTETLSVTAAPSSTMFNPLNMTLSGYIFDNVIICQALDSGGQNPISLECVDLFACHPSAQDYHRHNISLPLFNWVIDNQLRVTGFMLDGYPIVAPFLVTDKTTGAVRVVQTSDLNVNHGIVANITFSMPSLSSSSTTTPPTTTQMSFGFFYVATFDWPYSAFAFYGTAVMPVSSSVSTTGFPSNNNNMMMPGNNTSAPPGAPPPPN